MSTKYPELPVATQTAMKPPDDEALLRPVPAAFSQTPVCRTETGISRTGHCYPAYRTRGCRTPENR